MIPTEFEYVTAASVEEALAHLEKHGEDAKLLAGGHSLIPLMKLRLAQPKCLIDIGHVKGLHGITHVIHGDVPHIHVGALTTHAEVAASELLARECSLLKETAAEIGDVQVRNRGTLGGSLAHADPAADYPAAILALDARIVVQGRGGERTIAATDFFTGTFSTAIGPGEILTGVRFPTIKGQHVSAYAKVHHPASGYAVVGIAVSLVLEAGEFREVRVGITGLGPQPFRAKAVEEELQGRAVDPAVIRAAAAHAADGVEPLSDIQTSAEYRAELARVHTRRAIERAVARAK